MEVFVLTNLERIRSETSRRDVEFREACDSVISQIQSNSVVPRVVPDDGDADRYFRPFQLACELRTAKIRIMALDCIERMVAFGYLRGTMRVMKESTGEAGKEISLVEIIMEAITLCKDDKSDDVQLRVIKAVLTIVGSNVIKAHEQTLLAAVKACLTICLNTKNQVTKNTAKTALRQVLNIAFGRMEASESAIAAGTMQPLPAPVPITPVAITSPSPAVVEAPVTIPPEPTQEVITVRKVLVKRTIRVPRPATAAVTSSDIQEQTETEKPPVLQDSLSEASTTLLESSLPLIPSNPFGEYMYAEVVASLGYIFEPSVALAETVNVVTPSSSSNHSSSSLTTADGVDKSSSSSSIVINSSNGAAAAPPEELFDEIEVEVEEDEIIVTAPTIATPAKPKAVAPPITPAAMISPNPAGTVVMPSEDVVGSAGRFASQQHKDAFMVFSLLSRGVLTMAGDQDIAAVGEAASASSGGFGLFGFGSAPRAAIASPSQPQQQVMMSDEALIANPLALQYKLLSMELVIGLLETCGPAMRNGARFIAAIKQYLCVGLLKNFVSSIPALSALSLKTFMALMRGFKRHIAAEIEVFLSAVFLRMLASPASSHEQKMNVLAAFRSMCTEPGSVLEMFLNYDCTEGRQNVFEDSVRVLASIAQGRSPASEGDSQNAADKAAVEAAQIKAASMQALSAVLSSIVLLADAAAKQMNETQGAGELEIGGASGGAPASASTSASGEDKIDDGEAAELAALRAESSRGSITSPTSSSSSSSSSSHPLSSSAALAKSYDEQKKRRALLEKAVVKFAVKPKKGIEYMQASGLCGDSPQAIAAIFHELKDVLDKTSIGEYMGEEKAQNVQTLHAYIDMIDFTDLTYDDAVRKFLSGFRLPGEAQKIDRMMEKFAERYCNCNPGVFPTADTAFILAYSIIMLHTDAHNPNIKPEKKMSKENFLKNNRGIANGADLPGEFLGAIYDSIRTRPFTLREDDALRAKVAPTQVDERTRQAQLAAERQMIVSQGHAAMSTARKQSTARLLAVAAEAEAAAAASSIDGQGGAEPSPAAAAALIADLGLSYYSVQDVLLADHVRPMFDVTWGALLATFSVNFEAAGETPEGVATVEACLLGFNQAIHVAGQLKLDEERDMLVSSLCKFTMLEQSQSSASAGAGLIKEFRGKHIAAMRALLSMTFNEGHNLGASWGPVLVCVSLLARLVNVSAGGKEDAHFFKAPPSAASQQQGTGSNSSAARREAERLRVALEKDMQTERLNAAIVGAHIHEADLTRLYLRSVALPTDAIVHFVTQLAAVSIQELSGVVAPVADFPAIGGGSSQRHERGILPRVFSLQKVVEVADFNMDVRPRMAWARVWDTLSRFFTAVCCSSNTGVAMFAIDSLKQLALKFMAKPELKSFSFQGKFLYPFLTIMEATSPAALAVARSQAKSGNQSVSGSTPSFLQPSPEIRELILHVCANIIRARHGNTRSGWRSLLGVYAAAASDTSEILVSFAFSTANEIVSQHFDAVVSSGAFVDAIKCMVAFGSNVHIVYALRAIDHCTTLGAHLARGHVPLENDVNNSSASGGGSGLSTQDSSHSISVSSGTSDGAVAGMATISEDSADWYDLDSVENNDVLDNARDRSLLAKLKSSLPTVSSSADGDESENKLSSVLKSATPSSAYLMSGEAEAEYASPETVSGNADGLEGDASARDTLLHDNATDVAVMLADDVKGGKIRRLNDSKAIMQLLWPLLTGLGGLISSDSRLKIRMRALSSLFLFLRRYGPGFTPELWSLVYGGVLLPIFDDVRHAGDDADDEVVVMAVNALQDQKNRASTTSAPSPLPTLSSDLEGGEQSAPHFSLSEFSSRSIPNPTQPIDVNSSLSRAAYWPAKKKALSAHTVVLAKQLAVPMQQQDEHEWLRTTCLPALSSLVKVQSRFFTRLHFLLPALLRLIEACVDQEIEGLARIGVASLRLLLADAGSKFETDTWTIVCASLARLFRSCTPIALQEARRHLLGEELSDPEEIESAEVNPELVQTAQISSNVASTQIDIKVSTLYGPGVLLIEDREGDGAFVVRLAWATLYTFSDPLRESPSVSVTDSRAPRVLSTRSNVLPSASNSSTTQLTLPFNAQRVVTQCVVQLELIGCAGVLADAHLSSLKISHVDELLSLLQGSAEFARKFNGDRKLRKALWERGFMRFAKHNKLPSLLRQESTATQQLLILLLRLYKHRDEATVGSLGTTTPWRDLSVRHLVSLIKGVLVRYTQLAIDVERAVALAVPPHMQVALQSPTVNSSGVSSNDVSSSSCDKDSLLVGDHSKDLFREAAAYAPIVLQLLDGVLSFDDDEFKENLSWLYPLLTGLITCGSVEIRARLRNVFEGRLKAMLPMS